MRSHCRPTVPLVFAVTIVILVLAPAVAQAQAAQSATKRLTLDDIFDESRRQELTGAAPLSVTWLDDATYIWPKRLDTQGVEWLKVDAERGRSVPFFDAARLEKALQAIGVSAADAARMARPRVLALNPAHTVNLMSVLGDLYTYEFASGRLTRLTSDAGEEMDAIFSPDGRTVAFTRNNNLFVVDVASQRERALTTDGTDQLLNGRLDWVYQEEIYGRGTYRAFWWSPDSTRLAFLQLDERPVHPYTIIDHVPREQRVITYPYPKPGDPNPSVRVGAVHVLGGPVRWIDTGKYSAVDHLVVRVSWTPDSRNVVHQVQNREQTWLDLNVGDASTGSSRTIFRETTTAWVDPEGDFPIWLRDGTFLWSSERDGWEHLYHYKADGSLMAQVTKGEWEVRSFYGADEERGWIYFAGTERSHIGDDIYRIKLDGTGLARLSKREGTHAAVFNPGRTLYVGTWSNAMTPPQTRLHRADGSDVRVIEENRVPALGEYHLATPEFLQVKTSDGFLMEAMLIKPPDFHPSRKYPVFQMTYAGPHAPQVRNAWGGVTYLYRQLLAQHGIVIWVCDNRSASGKGAVSAFAAYKRLGETELADIEEGLHWLKSQPWVDASRIGIDGWSYGGFMVSYALTHSKSFAMGIAGGSVTDWHEYDSVYTERFMLMPQNNPEGYERTSVTRAAKNLSGRLLLVHGAVDDNVHLQNTMQFAYALQKEGKPFELMVYPTQQHGVVDPQQAKHMRIMMLDFVLRTLKPEGVEPAVAPSGR